MSKKVKKELSAESFKRLENPAKTLFANIRFSSIDTPIKTICVTSSSLDEGKTTTAVVLARAIATSGNTVLLVEADMRRRSLAAMMKVAARGGAYSVLAGTKKLEEVVTPLATPNLFFLDIEPSIPNPADILSSKRYADLVKLLSEKFDYVVFDTPPVGTFVDAAILSSLVDGTVFVVRSGKTRKDTAVQALAQLQQANAHMLGTVLTFCDNRDSDYYSYYTQRMASDGQVSVERLPESVRARKERGHKTAAHVKE